MRIQNVCSAVSIAAANCVRPSYLGMLAHASWEWKWRRFERSLKAVALGTLVRDPQDVTIVLSPQVFGETPVNDMLALGALVRLRRPATLFEFGTFRGYGTLNLAMNAPTTAELFTLDVPPATRDALTPDGWDRTVDDQVIGEAYRGSPYSDRVTQLLEDSRTLDTAPYKGRMEFIFVDASHEYEFVVNDSGKAFEMLADDGIIAWHDYSPVQPGVVRYLEDLAAQREVFWIEGTQIAFVRGRSSQPC